MRSPVGPTLPILGVVALTVLAAAVVAASAAAISPPAPSASPITDTLRGGPIGANNIDKAVIQAKCIMLGTFDGSVSAIPALLAA